MKKKMATDDFKFIICKKIPKKLLDKEVCHIGLSVWCSNALKHNDVHTINDVLKYGNNFDVEFLKNFRRLGVKCVIELKLSLLNLGIINKI